MSLLTSGAYKMLYRIPLPLSLLLHILTLKSKNIKKSHSTYVDSPLETWDTWRYLKLFKLFFLCLQWVNHTWLVKWASYLPIIKSAAVFRYFFQTLSRPQQVSDGRASENIIPSKFPSRDNTNIPLHSLAFSWLPKWTVPFFNMSTHPNVGLLK